MSRPRWLCDQTGQPVTPTACRACAQALQVPACPVADVGLLAALERSMVDDPVLAAVRGLGLPVLRVSSLVGCTRQGWYGLREDYPLETPSRLWPRLRGTIFHRGLEGEEPGSEERLVYRLVLPDGRAAIIAGRVDGYHAGVLRDFKTMNGLYLTPRCPTHRQRPMRRGQWGWHCTQIVGREGGQPQYCQERTRDRFQGLTLPKAHHVQQLALYAWLVWRAKGERVTRGQITYLTMGDLVRVDVPVPTTDAALAAFEAALTRQVGAILQPDAPPGDPTEAWECRYCPWAKRCPDKR